MTYDNTDRGVLFKNDRKNSDSQPDYKGNINVGGVEYWLSAWVKEGAKGKFMSLSVTQKEAQQRPPAQQATPKRNDYAEQSGGTRAQTSGGSLADIDDDIPFGPMFGRKAHYL